MYLQDTRVENLFIYEFLPSAPEGYVKVYLFGLMYAQNEMSMDTAKLSRVLKIPEADVLQAWEYWAEKELVRIEYSKDFSEYNIEYLSLIDKFYAQNNSEYEQQANTSAGNSAGKSADTASDTSDQNGRADADATDYGYSDEDEAARAAVNKVIDMEVSAIFKKYEELTGRMISTEDAWRIGDTIRTYNILPDVMSYAVDYCIGEDRASINYITKTAIRWAQEGCKNLAEVKAYIDKTSKRNQYYNIVFREMGWNRLPNPGDREIMDRWFDELGCTIKEVRDACRSAAGLREPSLKYVNKVLENKRLEAGGINTRNLTKTTNAAKAATGGDVAVSQPVAPVSKKVLKEYYEYLRHESEREQDARIDEVCSKIIALRELFEFENTLNREMLELSVGPDAKDRKQLLRSQRRDLEAEKHALLEEHGYSKDYLDRKYRCELCKDSGITDDGRVCACSEARAREAYTWNQKRKH